MAARLCSLSWRDHNRALISFLGKLLEVDTLVDCSLAAEGHQIKAHKVVLSACSPYLKMLFSEEKDKYPIIILQDVKFQDLKALMDFMYKGEIQIPEERVATLLRIAQNLQIRGLSIGEEIQETVRITQVPSESDGTSSLSRISLRRDLLFTSERNVELSSVLPLQNSWNKGATCDPLPQLQASESKPCGPPPLNAASSYCPILPKMNSLNECEKRFEVDRLLDEPEAQKEVTCHVDVQHPICKKSEREVKEKPKNSQSVSKTKPSIPPCENLAADTCSAVQVSNSEFDSGSVYECEGDFEMDRSLNDPEDRKDVHSLVDIVEHSICEEAEAEGEEEKLGRNHYSTIPSILPGEDLGAVSQCVVEISSPNEGHSCSVDDQDIEVEYPVDSGDCMEMEGPLDGIVHSVAEERKVAEQDINGEVLLELTEGDLKADPEMSSGDKKLILKFLKEVKSKEAVLLNNVIVTSKPLKEASYGQHYEYSNVSTVKALPQIEVPERVLSANTFPPISHQFSWTGIPPKNRFSRYNSVEETLRNHPQGEDLHEVLMKGPISENDRRCLVRIVVAELQKAQESPYPDDASKQALAQALVLEYPLLKDNVLGGKGYEHFFDPVTKKGFITYRLWTVQKGLPASKKKYNIIATKRVNKKFTANFSRCNSENILSQNKLTEKILWMQGQFPNEENRLAIKTCLMETWSNRKTWIAQERPTMGQIIERYPKLLDYGGEMIANEFKLRYPECGDNLMKKFGMEYSSKIIGYVKTYRWDLVTRLNMALGDDNLKALILLSALIPMRNSLRNGATCRKRAKVDSQTMEPEATYPIGQVPNPELMIVLPEDTNLQSMEATVCNTSKDSIQPFMMWIKGQEKDSCFIRGDGWLVRPPENDRSPLAAFDLLFKLYHILQVDYPKTLSNFFNFFEVYLYKLGKVPTSAVSSVHINIVNFKTDN